MRYALEKSLNIPSIKLLERVGIQSAIDVAQKMGIKSRLEPGLALALGASEVSILELTSAFGVFANGGLRVEPTAIAKIENARRHDRSMTTRSMNGASSTRMSPRSWST